MSTLFSSSSSSDNKLIVSNTLCLAGNSCNTSSSSFTIKEKVKKQSDAQTSDLTSWSNNRATPDQMVIPYRITMNITHKCCTVPVLSWKKLSSMSILLSSSSSSSDNRFTVPNTCLAGKSCNASCSSFTIKERVKKQLRWPERYLYLTNKLIWLICSNKLAKPNLKFALWSKIRELEIRLDNCTWTVQHVPWCDPHSPFLKIMVE